MTLMERLLEEGFIPVGRRNIVKSRTQTGEDRYLIYLPMHLNPFWDWIYPKRYKVEVYLKVIPQSAGKGRRT